jgi:hypothetical protein
VTLWLTEDRFFDRISDTFKEDKWSPIVRQIRTLWYQCAQHTGNVEAAAKLLLEMMSPSMSLRYACLDTQD